MSDPNIRYRTILLVEGDDRERFLFADAIRKIDDTIKYYLMEHAHETFQVLECAAVIPEVIFLHVNVNMQNGFKFLSMLKQSATLQHIPVVVLTTSSAADQLHKGYQLGAMAVIVKPARFEAFWLEIKRILSCDLTMGSSPLKPGIAAVTGL
ncbi:MAG TPA: response regulator [Ohtaekwangia sp.]|nr:response regulator [Ohtaekwangia sp.]